MAEGDGAYTRDPLIRTFGAVLRAYREAAPLSRPQLAEALGCRPGWIEKLETAQKPPSEATSDDLDVFFKTGPARTFWTMWRQIKREGKHLAALPGFPQYAAIEAKAVTVRKFEAQAIPGILQTPAYARAMISARQSPAPIEERVASRMERQETLIRDDGPRMWFVLDEAALRRPIGGPEIMREQLQHLIDITSNIRIEIRVLPFSSVTYAGLDGAFTVLGLPGGQDVGYHEGPGISQLIDDGSAVAEYRVRFDLVMGESLRIGESLTVIHKIMEEYT